jgi:hypothetical protein
MTRPPAACRMTAQTLLLPWLGDHPCDRRRIGTDKQINQARLERMSKGVLG